MPYRGVPDPAPTDRAGPSHTAPWLVYGCQSAAGDAKNAENAMYASAGRQTANVTP
jgi:hypothetical protein